jgi:hypothetical protein
MNTIQFRRAFTRAPTHAPRRARGWTAVLGLALLAGHAALAQAPAAAPNAPSIPGVASQSADIRDIRPPKAMPSPWLMPLVVLTGLLAMGGGVAAWNWNRRRLRTAGVQPWELALERLEGARELMQPDRGREFSIEVSDVVRGYIESRFEVRAAHLTTHEFLHALLENSHSLLAGHHGLLENFLETCDLGKFGGWQLAASDMERMLQSARRFVLESRESLDPGAARPVAAAAAEPSLKRAVGERYASFPTT